MPSKPPPFPTSFDFNLTPKMVAIAAGVLAVLGVAFTAVYPVPADSVSVVLRFGKYARTQNPGLNFKWPLGIESKILVPTRRQLKMEFGFGTAGNTNDWQYNTNEFEAEKDMVTGDRNAVLVLWIIQYKLTNEQHYLFNVRNPEATLRDATESVMRQVVGDRAVEDVITTGRQGIAVEALEKLQALIDSYEMGITIDQVQLIEVDPPSAVQGSFNEVNQAEQERDRAQNEAYTKRNEVIPQAEGDADKAISEAQGYALQRVNEADGDAARFKALFSEYQKAPEVTKRRIYLETISEVLPTVGKKVIIDEEAKSVLPLLQLGGN